jgi:hypothetical protein
MAPGGHGDPSSADRESDEANIRWLLAAVLHHQADDDPADEDD